MAIKLIAFDLDGTIVHDDRITISDQDLADILNGKPITTNPINTPTFVMHNGNIVGVVTQSNDKLKLDTFLYEEGND